MRVPLPVVASIRTLVIATTALLLATSTIAIPSSGATEAPPHDGSVVQVNPFYAWPFYAWNEPTGGGPGYSLDEQLDLDAVHDYAEGRRVVIATIDTGVDLSNDKIRSHMEFDGWDFVDLDDDLDDDQNGADDDLDGVVDEAHGHGTYVAEILVHVAPEAELLPVRAINADGIGSVAAVVAGIHYAIDHGADVISLSLGTDVDEPELRAAIDRADRHDVVVVASAGNSGTNTPQYPAAYDSVIGVGAYDLDHGRLAGFSAWGDHVDVSAAGVSFHSPSPRKKIKQLAGSSFAAPIVAAQAALLRGANPGWTADLVSDQIRLSAEPESGSKRSKHGRVQLVRSLAAPHASISADVLAANTCADASAELEYDEDDRELEIEIDLDKGGSIDLTGLADQIGHLAELPRKVKDDREITVDMRDNVSVTELPKRTLLSHRGSPILVCWTVRT